MSIFLVRFEDKRVLVKAKKSEQASSIAFHVFLEEFDCEAKRLAELGYPSETDVIELDELSEIASPVALE